MAVPASVLGAKLDTEVCDGDPTCGVGALCGICGGRKAAEQRSNSRQSKKDLAIRYSGYSLASKRDSFRSGLIGYICMGVSSSSSTSVSNAPFSAAFPATGKEFRSSAALHIC